MPVLRSFFAAFLLAASSAAAATFYISPTGSDTNAGTSQTAPWKTFAKAFSSMGAANTLVLLDGTYSVAAGTGVVSDTLGGNSAAPPSGTGVTAMTAIQALNPGNVKIVGASNGSNFNLQLGTSGKKRSFIRLQDITWDGDDAQIYNTDHLYIKGCGFHSTTSSGNGVFNVGTNDGNWGNSYLLLEDSWMWTQNRMISLIFRSDHVIYRRLIARNDGCSNTANCGPGAYNLGVTVYNSSQVSLQNIVILDNVFGSAGTGGAMDFQTAWHTNADGGLAAHAFGQNEWLGTISLNSQYGSYRMEADSGISSPAPLHPTYTLNNIVGWAAYPGDPVMSAQLCDNCDLQITNLTFNHSATNASGQDIMYTHVSTGGTNFIRNAIAYASASMNSAFNIPFAPSYADTFTTGSWTNGAYNQVACTTGCKTTNPLADGTTPSLKYIARIETGSALKGTGFGGSDYGANVVYRIGTDGTFWGDPGYNTLTTTYLWPLPNESLAKQQMCAGVTRGFCAKASLTEYVWTYLGNPTPAEFTGVAPPPASPCDLNADGVTNQTDVNLAINQAIGISACSTADLQQNGSCDVVDVQRVINASLGQSCKVGP